MSLQECGHVFVADELAALGLLRAFTNRCSRLIVETHRLAKLGEQREQYFSGLVLVGLRQLTCFRNGLFEQLCHSRTYSTDRDGNLTAPSASARCGGCG